MVMTPDFNLQVDWWQWSRSVSDVRLESTVLSGGHEIDKAARVKLL